MTLRDAIIRADAARPNTATEEEKLTWLCDIEAQLRYFHRDAGPAAILTPDSGPDTPLLVPPPFDRLYIHWLVSQYDLLAGDYELYNSSISLFNHAYADYMSALIRDTPPVAAGRFGY